jgi:hypothetical protein
MATAVSADGEYVDLAISSLLLVSQSLKIEISSVYLVLVPVVFYDKNVIISLVCSISNRLSITTDISASLLADSMMNSLAYSLAGVFVLCGEMRYWDHRQLGCANQ